MAESKQGIYCDYCFEEGQTTNATAFCGKCGKYLCDSCVKQHGKFLPGHKLISGSEMPNRENVTAFMPCKIHSDQIVEFFCEGHKDFFCKLCKLVKHSTGNCAVKYIQEAVEKINVKSEFEASFADLLQLQELMKEKQTENQYQLDTYSKNKNEMKSAAESLRKQLNEIFDTYQENLNAGEQTTLAKISLKVQSYTSFLSQLESQLKAKKAIEHEPTDKGLFLSVTEMRLLYDAYKQEVDTLERKVAGPKSLALQDERLPSVIQKLHQISSLNEVGCAEVEVEKPAPTYGCHSNIMKDQSCQVGEFSHDYFEAKTEEVRICNTALTTMDDGEHGSSDDVTEQAMITYPEVSFSDIKSCSVESAPKAWYDITDCCFMPDGQAVLCTSFGLIVLDSDLKEKVILHIKEQPPKAIDVMDTKNVVVSVPAAKLLQIISIIPNLQIGRKIDLKCYCSGLKCHGNKIFVISDDLFVTSCFKYQGIQVLDGNGELLKTIPMLDYVANFCLTRNGNIVYKCHPASQEYRIKCITQDNTDIFSYPLSNSTCFFIPDDEGNVIIHQNSTVSIVKSDGTPGKVLVDRKGKNPSLLPIYHNRYSNTLFMLAVDYEYIDKHRRDVRWLYKIEMS